MQVQEYGIGLNIGSTLASSLDLRNVENPSTQSSKVTAFLSKLVHKLLDKLGTLNTR